MAQRHGRRRLTPYILRISKFSFEWPLAGLAGLLMAGLALFLLVGFGLHLTWYALAAYAALIAVTVSSMRFDGSRWLMPGLTLATFGCLAFVLPTVSPVYLMFLAAAVLGIALSFWIGYRAERDSAERDAFRRERKSP